MKKVAKLLVRVTLIYYHAAKFVLCGTFCPGNCNLWFSISGAIDNNGFMYWMKQY